MKKLDPKSPEFRELVDKTINFKLNLPPLNPKREELIKIPIEKSPIRPQIQKPKTEIWPQIQKPTLTYNKDTDLIILANLDDEYGKYKHFLVDEGDLIIASSGIKVEYFDKKMGFVQIEHLPLCMNTSTIRFKTLNENELDIKYFSYFLKTNNFK